MEIANLICEILEEMDLQPYVEEDYIEVKYEAKTLCIDYVVDETENGTTYKYVSIQLPAFYMLGDENEITEVLLTCNRINRELRQIKTYLTEDLQYVTSSFEFWFLNREDLRNSMKWALIMFSNIRPLFHKTLREIQSADTEI